MSPNRYIDRVNLTCVLNVGSGLVFNALPQRRNEPISLQLGVKVNIGMQSGVWS